MRKYFILNKSSGFTLLEVMVALVIIALVLLSLLRITALQANQLQYLGQKNIAQWVALDTIARIQAGLIPLSGTSNLSGQETQFNEDWFWQVNLMSTADPNAVQAVVEVKPSLNSHPVVHFVTYLSTNG